MSVWRLVGVGCVAAATLLSIGWLEIPAGPRFTSQTGTPTTPNARSVAIVGDSLAWQAKNSLEAELSEAGYFGPVSVDPGQALSSSWAQNELSKDLRTANLGIIVVETASNDAAQAARGVVTVKEYSDLLTHLLESAQKQCVVVVNAKTTVSPAYYGSHVAMAINQIIEEAGEHHSNERVLNWNEEAWAHPSWFASDLLHFSPGLPGNVAEDSASPTQQTPGETAVAQAIMTAIHSCPAGAT
jgi:hypothetical protein